MNSVKKTIALLQRGYLLEMPEQKQTCTVFKPSFWDEARQCFMFYRGFSIRRATAEDVIRQLYDLYEFRMTDDAITLGLGDDHVDHVFSKAIELWANEFAKPRPDRNPD